MARNKCPYKFPARSREAMIQAMESVGGYYENHRRYPFSWNVKIHSIGKTGAVDLGKDSPDYGPYNPQWDSAFDSYLESDSGWFYQICENMAEYYTSGDYCTYPGDDRGEFSFAFGGRQGGHLLLTEAYGINLRGFDLDDLRHHTTPYGREESDYTFEQVRTLYKAVMTMESDFTAEKIQAEFRYQLGFMRAQWEEERCEDMAAAAKESTDLATKARALLAEFKTVRTVAGFPVICSELRATIAKTIKESRAHKRRASFIASGRLVAA